MTDEIDLTSRRFSTDRLPQRERVARWREEFGRTLVQVDIEPSETDAPFNVSAVLQRLPGLGLLCCNGSPTRVHCTKALAADKGNAVGLIINLGAPVLAAQRGAEVLLGEGDAVLVNPDEPGLLRDAAHYMGLAFPRSALAERIDDIDGAVMKRIAGGDAALRLLHNYVRLVQSEPELASPALQQAVANHVHDLAALIFGADRDTREKGARSVGAERLRQAVAYIGRHFTDPDLTIASVASGQGISPRYLQELLEQSGTSFTARVNELRLKRAFALLTRFPGRPVAEVAARAGFSNVSHFNRLFRQRFGDTPSGVRGGSNRRSGADADPQCTN